MKLQSSNDSFQDEPNRPDFVLFELTRWAVDLLHNIGLENEK